jgi:c-di-GMP-binding flagellar brake protein YcgR
MGVIKIGMPITLELREGEQEKPEKYKCKLVDHNQTTISVDYPVNVRTKKTGFFLEGTEFQASFVGEDESVYQFETVVIERRKINIPMIVLTFPGERELIRIQRRKYVRVESCVDAVIKGKNHSLNTITHDISGGGVALIQHGSTSFSEQQLVDLTLVLPMNSGNNSYVQSKGRIIRILPQSKRLPNRVSVEFEDISEQQRQSIIKYCFEQQMHMRKLGLK